MLLQQRLQRRRQLILPLVLDIQRGGDGDGGGLADATQLLNLAAVLARPCGRAGIGAVLAQVQGETFAAVPQTVGHNATAQPGRH